MPNCRPLVLLLAALLVAPAAYAKGEKNKRVVVKKGESKAEAAPGGGGNTSADNRQGKIATVAVDVIGFTMMPTFGARGEFFLGADNTIALVATTGSTKFGNFEADKKLIEARFKHFFTNSFYMDGGLGVELWDIKYGVLKARSASFEEKQVSGTLTNVGAELHIGNQWQWGGFTLGCDWVGYFLQLSSSLTPGKADDLDADDQKNQEEDLKSLLGGSNPHLVRLYLGFSF